MAVRRGVGRRARPRGCRLPADVDCTSVGLAVLAAAGAVTPAVLHRGLQRIAANTDRDGVIEVYLDPEPERAGIIDPVVCANALYLLAMYERDHEAEPTREFLHHALVSGACIRGTRYYPSEDTLLCRVARLVRAYPDRYEQIRKPLVSRLRQRLGISSQPLEIAQRIIPGSQLGLPVVRDRQRLCHSQLPDGSWPIDAYFRYGRSRIYFGSEVLSTAFCVRALDGPAPAMRSV